MTHICVMISHKPIIFYMGGLILGVNSLYRLFCSFKLFPMVGKWLKVMVTEWLTWLPYLYYSYLCRKLTEMGQVSLEWRSTALTLR